MIIGPADRSDSGLWFEHVEIAIGAIFIIVLLGSG
jgi:hypothetical protein